MMIDEAYADYMADCRRFMKTINAHQVMDFGRKNTKTIAKTYRNGKTEQAKSVKAKNNGKNNDNTQHNGNFRFSDSFCDVVGIV